MLVLMKFAVAEKIPPTPLWQRGVGGIWTGFAAPQGPFFPRVVAEKA